jgi:hypothetical protein
MLQRNLVPPPSKQNLSSFGESEAIFRINQVYLENEGSSLLRNTANYTAAFPRRQTTRSLLLEHDLTNSIQTQTDSNDPLYIDTSPRS